MSLDIVRGRIKNPVATQELIKIIENESNCEDDQTLYLGYPLSANIERNITVDSLLLSKKMGLTHLFSLCLNTSIQTDILQCLRV